MPNVFRILGSVDALNRKMVVNLTHHDVNWVYNSQYLKDTGYYFKTRVPLVRLISCLLESNKGLDQDFLIVSGEWHDGLHCPTRDGQLGGVFIGLSEPSFPIDSEVLFLIYSFYFFIYIGNFLSGKNIFFKLIHGLLPYFHFYVADKQFTTPNSNLVNSEDLNRILRSKIFLHNDGQLCVAHVILGCKPISSSFQSPKYVIKARDPRLPLIDIVVLGFIAGSLRKGTQHIYLTNL